MKRLTLLLPVFIFSILAMGASIFEGAAAVSQTLPGTGNYVATNSFPRNTVVDLTNLGTGKTVRAIVSSGLDTPGGLLAEISREAADSIGLANRTIGRIRMRAVSDPSSLSVLNENGFRSNDADYNPMAAIEQFYNRQGNKGYEPSTVPPVVEPPVYIPPVQPPITREPQRNTQGNPWGEDVPTVAVKKEEPPPNAILTSDISREEYEKALAAAEAAKKDAAAAKDRLEAAKAEAEAARAEAAKAKAEADEAIAKMEKELSKDNPDVETIALLAAQSGAQRDRIQKLLTQWEEKRNEIQKRQQINSDNELYGTLDDIPGARPAVDEFRRKRDEVLGR